MLFRITLKNTGASAGRSGWPPDNQGHCLFWPNTAKLCVHHHSPYMLATKKTQVTVATQYLEHNYSGSKGVCVTCAQWPAGSACAPPPSASALQPETSQLPQLLGELTQPLLELASSPAHSQVSSVKEKWVFRQALYSCQSRLTTH